MVAATFLALGSAVLHATWNLLVKTSSDRLVAAWGLYLTGGIFFLPVFLVIDRPGADALPFLAASSVVHVVYVVALTRAYQHGDFSFAYPLARGGGALFAAIGGVLFLADSLSALAWLAIAIVVGGLASLVRPGVSRVALLWAGLTAATIGVYTTLDAAGARRSSGLGYGIAIVLGAGLAQRRHRRLGPGRAPGPRHRTGVAPLPRRRRVLDPRLLDGPGRGPAGARRLRRRPARVLRDPRRRGRVAVPPRAAGAGPAGIGAGRDGRPRAADRLAVAATGKAHEALTIRGNARPGPGVA